MNLPVLYWRSPRYAVMCRALAELAKARLLTIIEIDRAAVPCGRWVRIDRPIRIPQLRDWCALRLVKYPAPHVFSPIKPRYRYEVRR